MAKDDDGVPYLEKNPMSWNKKFNVAFLDNPVGTGFSHSASGVSGTYPTLDTQVAELLVEALTQVTLVITSSHI